MTPNSDSTDSSPSQSTEAAPSTPAAPHPTDGTRARARRGVARPRRSKRAVKKDGAISEEPSPEPPHEPASKKRKTSRAKDGSEAPASHSVRRRSKSLKLSRLPSMPLDTLLEIFRNLGPADLVNLSRTDKHFRSLLLDRSIALSVWRDSLRQVEGLPECPPGMSEPAWANLVFSPYCHFCLTHTPHVAWSLRIRICHKCSGVKHLVQISRPQQSEWKKILEGLGYSGHDSQLESLIPCSVDTKKDVLLCFKHDYDALSKDFLALRTQNTKKKFVKQHRDIVSAIESHSKSCIAWEQRQKTHRNVELQQLKNQRKDAIIAKLEELGWGDEVKQIRSPDSLAAHKLVNRPQLLTDKVWSHIKDDILVFMAEMKRKRLEREYAVTKLIRKDTAVKVLKAFKKKKGPGRSAYPNPRDYCNFPAIQDIVNLPADVNVDEKTFEDAVSALPTLISEWRVKVDQELMQVLKRDEQRRLQLEENERAASISHDWVEYCVGLPPPPKTIPEMTDEEAAAKIKLACMVFECKSCKPTHDDCLQVSDETCGSPCQPLFYPQVIEHACLKKQSDYGSSNAITEPYIEDAAVCLHSHGIERSLWNAWHLRYHRYGSKCAEVVVKAAGLDPASATSQDMDQEDFMFICEGCCKKRKEENPSEESHGVKVALYEWRAMVRHLMDLHFLEDEKPLTKVRRNDLSEDIKVAERERHITVFPQWLCMHCFDTVRDDYNPHTHSEVMHHLDTRHTNVKSRVLDEDYFEHFTAPDIRARYRPLWVRRLPNGQLTLIPPDDQKGRDYDKVSRYPDLNEVDKYDRPEEYFHSDME